MKVVHPRLVPDDQPRRPVPSLSTGGKAGHEALVPPLPAGWLADGRRGDSHTDERHPSTPEQFDAALERWR
ncbi:hypothetical protein DAETH_04600 [Deinococcus aetherius]|uniref:Uncharacterized protein n=1 Tax=Deinococcus aetherius TaxID=200252 RepID=A0ABM8AA52_9DEIO|nr:hypothetical protein [Deinococcus aetherius]BDP40491.1 hypothetical protein DAETH_04600 [Deinococcus aetherius]